MKIQIVGQEDLFQKKLLENVLAAIKESHCKCELDVIHELQDILEMEKYQFIITPALIVNNHILCEGHIWDKEHIKHFFEKAIKEEAG
jgi:hypothetical protein